MILKLAQYWCMCFKKVKIVEIIVAYTGTLLFLFFFKGGLYHISQKLHIFF